MGRLTLNVLLSFAQFEREVTAERIRDKIAASRKKGMWMGGHPPLGYDVQNKILISNQEEVKTVRRIFEAYLALGSSKALSAWTKAAGVVTKVRLNADGSLRAGGRPFSRGNLHAPLKYRTHNGEVSHKGNIYKGEQEAIVDRDLWEQVQARLGTPGLIARVSGNIISSASLTGIIHDQTGDRLTPIHASKKGPRYHYYVSTRLIETKADDPSGWRLPARGFEQLIFYNAIQISEDAPKNRSCSINVSIKLRTMRGR